MKNKKNKVQGKLLEGSRAIALTIKNINPEIISAYPITPQTHIVEDLAKFKGNYEYVRAESEFAAASIVLGGSAAGLRTYTATSSQGLLLMNEVVYSIAGMRLPVVMTVANRAISSPINIWNDHQDAMTIKDAGWLMFFAESTQESVLQHILAYKIAEKIRIPVMLNIDGFILTHSFEANVVPNTSDIKKFLPKFQPQSNEYLNTKEPRAFGTLVGPKDYTYFRQELFDDLDASLELIKKEYKLCLKKVFGGQLPNQATKPTIDNGLIEYCGPKKPETIIIGMGSVIGTIKETIKENKNVGVLKIKCLRPFPKKEINKIIKGIKEVNIIDKAVDSAYIGPLAKEIQAFSLQPVASYIAGLGGQDITVKMIEKIIKNKKQQGKTIFLS
jgi:pyruvate ferredoxin oxidoreductase alpha subunit